MLLVLSAAGAAPAEESLSRDDRLSVLQRVLDTYGPPGLRVGSSIVDASVEVESAYDSNVRASGAHARSDLVGSVRPAFTVESDGGRDAFALKAEGEFRKYLDHPSENVSNAGVGMTGRIDLAANAYLLAGGGFQLLHEDRGALVAVNGTTPTQYTVTSGKAGFVIEPSPLGLRLDSTVDSYAYDNTALPGGAVVNETARDRVVFALEPRVSYQIMPQYNAFVRAVVNRRQYNQTREADGLGRDSAGYAADLGAALDIAGFARGELYLGYLRQDYDAKAAKPIAALDFGINLEWRPAEATSVRLNLSRSIEESALPGARGELQTAASLGIEHELLQRFVVLGSARFVRADFGSPVGAADLFDLNLGARYFLSSNLSAGLEYDFRHRDANALLPSYTRQIVAFRLRGRL